MKNFIDEFSNDESGAITVDFVVLTGALVLLGFLIMSIVGTQVETNAKSVKDYLISQKP